MAAGHSAVWDADAVRDDVREDVVEHLYDEAAVLVVDETGDVKKAYLVHAGSRGHAAVDRELYIPLQDSSCRTVPCR